MHRRPFPGVSWCECRPPKRLRQSASNLLAEGQAREFPTLDRTRARRCWTVIRLRRLSRVRLVPLGQTRPQMCRSLREIAVPGSEAGLVLHHLSNALGADPNANEWAVIVMRAMVQ